MKVKIRKFNLETTVTLDEVRMSKAYKLAEALANGKKLTPNDRIWLAKAAHRSDTFGGYAGPNSFVFRVGGYEIDFTKFLKRYIFRMAGEYIFRILWSTDITTLRDYLEQVEEDEQTTLAELYELPNTYIE